MCYGYGGVFVFNIVIIIKGIKHPNTTISDIKGKIQYNFAKNSISLSTR